MAGANDNATLIIVLEAQAKKLQNQLVDVTGQIDRFAAQTTRRFDQMNAANAASFDKLGTQVKGSLNGITSAVGALGLGIGIKQVIDYANSWQTLGNKLKSASSYSGLQLESLEDLTAAASAARTPLTDYVTLYSRIATASGALHLTQLQIAGTTDLVSKAFKIGGSTAAQQAGGIIQLTEAMETGFVQGRQLRSIATDAPVIAQALAAYMKTTVGGLKILGAQGKITSEDLINAILDYKVKINTAFASTQVTISDAITKINNAFMEFVGTQGESTGAIGKLVDALTYLADNFKTIAPIVLDFLAIVGGALAAQAFVGFAGGVGEAVFALGTFLATILTGEVTVAGLAAAMGPLALVIGAAAAAMYVFSHSSNAADQAIATLNGDIDKNSTMLGIAQHSSEAYRTALEQQIATQIRAAEAALEEAGAQYQAAKARSAERATESTGQQTFDRIMDTVTGNALGTDPEKDAAAALAQINKAKDALTKLQGQGNLASWQQSMTPGTADQAKGDGNEPPPAKSGSKTKGNSFASATASIQKQTDALNAQTTAQAKLNPFVEDYGYAETEAKTASDLLSDAEKAHIKITPELKAAINQLATGYAAATAKSKELAESQQELVAKTEAWRDTIKSATSTFITDLVQGKSAAEALGDALTDIGNQLLNMGLDTLLGGGQFGDKSSPLGAIGKLFGFANGGIASHGRPLPMFASGGISNSASIFGEAGPEAAIPLPDGRSVPVTLSMPSASSAGTVHVPIAINIDATGADPQQLARVSVQLSTLQANLPSTIVGQVRKAKKMRQL